MIGTVLAIWYSIDLSLRFILVYMCRHMRKGISMLSAKCKPNTKIKLINSTALTVCQTAALISTIGLCCLIVVLGKGNVGVAILVILLCLIDPHKSQVVIQSIKLGREYKRVAYRIKRILDE